MRVALGLLMCLGVLAGAGHVASAQTPKPLIIEGKRTLFQRVIVRPGATIHPAASDAAGKPVPGFSVFYVYARQGDWAQVGAASDGKTDGWIKLERLIDWRQTMTLAFTNPAGRDRAMFFADRAKVAELVASPRMGQDAAALRQSAVRAPAPGSGGAGSPVIALEPESFVDIGRNFYLLPILSAEVVRTDANFDARLLEIVSIPATPGPPKPAAPDPDALKNFKGGLVFVIDTTKSMQPYIDRTKLAIKGVIERIRTTPVKDNFRFGVVGFRSNMDRNPALEYVARVFAAPDLSQPPDAILPVLDQIKATEISTPEFDEDVFAGLKLALEKIDWQPFGGRWIVFVTDAGALKPHDPLSSTRLGPDQIRLLAKERGVALMALHLLTPEGRAYHANAKAQYGIVTDFGAAGALYYPVPDGSVANFGTTVDVLTEALLAQVSKITGQQIGDRPVPAAPAATRAAPDLGRQVDIVGNAMRLAYLGRQGEARAPDVFRAFTIDKDWTDPRLASLEVRVLLTRSQLSDLADSLKLILDRGLANRMSPQQFFTQLKAAAAAASRDPRRLGDLEKIGDLLGEYLDGLPYRSKLMELTAQEWLQMGGAGQREVLNEIESKLRLYQEYSRQTDLWVSFDGGRVPGDAMFPVPLEALP